MYNDDIDLTINYTNPASNGNLAEKLTEKQRERIGDYIKTYVEEDDATRADWLKQNTEGLKLAAQIAETKNYPWPKASNVKYPLVTVAAIQFNSRAHKAIINSGTPVKAGVNGVDPDGTKQQRANRVASHMSYQCMQEDPDWYDDTDRLSLLLSIVGQVHRKRYYSPTLGRPASRLVEPQNMIINFDAKSTKNCRRAEILEMSPNEVHELEITKAILPIKSDPERMNRQATQDKKILTNQEEPENKDDIPHVLYEVHWHLDLDNDGYREPYTILINALDGQLLSIAPRWNADGVVKDEDNKVVRIEGINLYTDYMFIPNPQSKTHGMGFGHLLGPVNESVNTLINQLIDAGTLATLQGGFVGRGVSMKGGALRFTPGMWKNVNATGAALKDNIFPLPIKEPSNVLFSLLGMLIQAGKEISSVTEMMQGQNPGQNTAATTASAMIEQGMQVFSGIYGRMHRKLGEEYKILYMINQKWHDPTGTQILLDDETPVEVLARDYESDDLDIKVASDPNIITDLQIEAKERSLFEMVQMGTVNPQYATLQRLRRLGMPQKEIEHAMNVGEPPPDPKILQIQLDAEKFEHQKKIDLMELEIMEESRGMEALKDQADYLKKLAEIEEMEGSQQLKALELMLKEESDKRRDRIDALLKTMQAKKAHEESKHVGDKPSGESSTGSNTGKSTS